jgi:hypothetical protein
MAAQQANGSTNKWAQLPALVDEAIDLNMSECNKMITYLAKKYDKQPTNMKDCGLSEQALGISETTYNTINSAMYPSD